MSIIDKLTKKFVSAGFSGVLAEPPSDMIRLRELTEQLLTAESERDLALEKLQFERLQLLSIFDGIDQPIHVLNTDTWEILFANKVMWDDAGEDILGKKCYEVFQGRETPCTFCPSSGLPEDDTDIRVVDYFNEVKGRWFHCISRRIHWPVPGNSHSAVFTLALDVTEEKNAMEALREKEELYRTLVDTSPDAVTMTDLDVKITYASMRTLELYGFKRKEDLVGRSAFDFIALEDHERVKENTQKTVEQGIVRNVKYTMLRSDGSRFVGELSASVVRDSEGNPKAFIATTREAVAD